MTCTQCGTENPDDNIFCTHCGINFQMKRLGERRATWALISAIIGILLIFAFRYTNRIIFSLALTPLTESILLILVPLRQ